MKKDKKEEIVNKTESNQEANQENNDRIEIHKEKEMRQYIKENGMSMGVPASLQPEKMADRLQCFLEEKARIRRRNRKILGSVAVFFICVLSIVAYENRHNNDGDAGLYIGKTQKEIYACLTKGKTVVDEESEVFPDMNENKNKSAQIQDYVSEDSCDSSENEDYGKSYAYKAEDKDGVMVNGKSYTYQDKKIDITVVGILDMTFLGNLTDTMGMKDNSTYIHITTKDNNNKKKAISFYQSGEFVTCKVVNGYLYVVSRGENLYLEEGADRYMPSINYKKISPKKICYEKDVNENAYIFYTSIDLKNPDKIKDCGAVLGYGNMVFLGQESLRVGNYIYQDNENKKIEKTNVLTVFSMGGEFIGHNYKVHQGKYTFQVRDKK